MSEPSTYKASVRSGFTLVEMLLTVILLGLFLTAIVVNFVGLERGSSLNEGVTQVEALFRFARAHAANSGRLVQIQAKTSSGTNAASAQIPDARELVLMYEKDPIADPGHFEPVHESDLYIQQIQDQVWVEDFKILNPQDEMAATSEPAPETLAHEEAPTEEPAAISFFPDGSSDSAEITLLSRQEEEPRKVLLRLSGILGTVERNPIYATNLVGASTGSDHEAALP